MHNPTNERIKRRYLTYLKEAMRHSEPTVDAAAAALARFEEYTKWRDFKTFRSEQAVGFKRWLAAHDGRVVGQKLSKATLHATLANLKRFFQWLSREHGYRSLVYSDAEYFNLTEKETRIATARREAKAPTLEQVLYVIDRMPAAAEIERRDRAIVAFILLTGARDRAVASFKLKHVDVVAGMLSQDAREVDTKNSKTFDTFFFPVGESARLIVVDWVEFLRRDMLWGNDDPLFPATEVRPGPSRHFVAVGLKRAHWSNAGPIRRVFRNAFASAGVPYFNPHSLRTTLARLGQQVCQSPEEVKAWSQNFGHESVLTTFRSYGHVETRRQGELIRHLASPRAQGTPSLDERVVQHIAQAVRTAFGQSHAREHASLTEGDRMAAPPGPSSVQPQVPITQGNAGTE